MSQRDSGPPQDVTPWLLTQDRDGCGSVERVRGSLTKGSHRALRNGMWEPPGPLAPIG